jgi:hypothetical protein
MWRWPTREYNAFSKDALTLIPSTVIWVGISSADGYQRTHKHAIVRGSKVKDLFAGPEDCGYL